MKKILLFFVLLIVSGCGTAISDTSENQGGVTNDKSMVLTANATNQPISNTEEAIIDGYSEKELVKLLDQLGNVRRQVVDRIEEKGWYESINEIKPSEVEFTKEIKPILTDTFTEAFVNKEVINKMEVFFCFCDAPTPLQGSLIPDVTSISSKDETSLQIDAYRPANGVNSGAKLTVDLKFEQGVWKIDQITQQFGTYEQSFQLTIEEIIAYYQYQGIDLEHMQTVQSPSSDADVFVFQEKETGEWIAIQENDWYLVRGKSLINQYYGEKEGVHFDNEV
ncbi:hypothetical protein [Aquibacillus salsiterrae]|uniref:DUF4878 domain-containing protein n=1 Tax=Aquibacillus salsiterrae TaxID=2950439 RepID=A0A9X3WDI6_9BACI|nr:hypothetical protein [Aquibacillus salsiterrae]MDC3416100.1 hypothetical protein [Aquibacillus salsiterrae]